MRRCTQVSKAADRREKGGSLWDTALAPTMVAPGCTWYKIIRKREICRVFRKLSATYREIKVTVPPSCTVSQSGNGSQHKGRHGWCCKAWGKDRTLFSHNRTTASKPQLSPNLHIITSMGLGAWPEPAPNSPCPNPPALLKAPPEHLLLVEFAFAEVPTGPSSCCGARR